MCYPVTCKQCGKTTWAGCGQHVASVKASVPRITVVRRARRTTVGGLGRHVLAAVRPADPPVGSGVSRQTNGLVVVFAEPTGRQAQQQNHGEDRDGYAEVQRDRLGHGRVLGDLPAGKGLEREESEHDHRVFELAAEVTHQLCDGSRRV